MTKALTKLLAVPALLAAGAQALTWITDIPVDAYYEVGTEFVLEWEPEDTPETFNLTLSTFLSNPILINPIPWSGPMYDFKDITIVLDDSAKLSDGSYTWVVDTVDGRTGDDYYYSFMAQYGYSGSSPRSFHVNITS
ncbi:hypothetical protein F4777DRAFT_166076 [Nemania sp. FL0916]|nr:hypothetical protein F4777DRAFT_166076 [Nemania sp. FL0916]